mmetsp:Transcript_83668/g.150939  ORF Transcript_83668/g.150939 Transcript_83668/m.150939 type:complete len:90 (+) Transcript_83668:110-379(+)
MKYCNDISLMGMKKGFVIPRRAGASGPTPFIAEESRRPCLVQFFAQFPTLGEKMPPAFRNAFRKLEQSWDRFWEKKTKEPSDYNTFLQA